MERRKEEKKGKDNDNNSQELWVMGKWEVREVGRREKEERRGEYK